MGISGRISDWVGAFPFMVRYPFDLLRAVSEVEPLTTNGESNTSALRDPFALSPTRQSR